MVEIIGDLGVKSVAHAEWIPLGRLHANDSSSKCLLSLRFLASACLMFVETEFKLF